MAMNKRERSIAMAVGAVVAILFLDYAVVEPLMAARTDVQDQIAKAQKDYNAAVRLILSQPTLERRFAEQKAAGLPTDISSAQQTMSHQLGEWGQMTGVEVTNIAPSNSPAPMFKIGGKPNEKDKYYGKLTCSAAIKGQMRQIGQFLYQIQTSEIPIRVVDMTFEPEKEGQDGLKITLKVSTIFLLPEPGTLARNAAAPSSTRPGAQAAGTTRPGALLAAGTTRPGTTRPGGGQNTMATGTTRPAATNASPVAGQSNGAVIANPGNMSLEEQMRLRRVQQSQPQAANVAAPASSAPATQPETR